ncbi:MAG: DUF6569 family protein [Bacteroidales bacterium]|nr:DUF6569 family protein [Bacteroidales bacterium]
MKIQSHSFQQFGNISLVQFSTLEGEGLPFLPAGPALDSGKLVIKEITNSGSVNYLLAINTSDDYLLLTDMDMLTGAKQNRVINVSVIIKPNSKQEINVSCVERSRWDYDSPKFATGKRVMDPKARLKKIVSLKEDHKTGANATQGEMWEHISESLLSNKLHAPTENYDAFLEDTEKKHSEKKIEFTPDKSCNGLAIFDNKTLVSFDLFGNRNTYAYYFSKLERNAAFQVRDEKTTGKMKQAEAFYSLGEFMDYFEEKLEEPNRSDPGRTGNLRWSGIDKNPGFNLTMDNQLVHMAGFSK